MPQAFVARTPTGVTLSKPEQFRWMPSEKRTGPMSAEETFFRQLTGATDEAISAPGANDGGSIAAIPGNVKAEQSALDFLQRTALDAQLSSDKILAIARKYKSKMPYPPGQLAESLSLIARMIAGGLPTRVYYASQGGFDTHAGQLNTHDRLMTELNDALSAFVADLKEQGNFDRVLLMTFSEFGRRVAENANGGTDHGDLKFNTDFRSVYGTVLDNWLKAPSELVLGHKFSSLPIIG